MNREELIGKLQMVYVGDKNALDELTGYYDGLKQVIEIVQEENEQLKERINNTTNRLNALIEFWKKYSPLDNTMEIEQFKSVIRILGGKE